MRGSAVESFTPSQGPFETYQATYDSSRYGPPALDSMLQDEAIDTALTMAFGPTKPTKHRPVTAGAAELSGCGVALADGDAGLHAAYHINSTKGTMVLAEGTGTTVAAEATVRVFEESIGTSRPGRTRTHLARQMQHTLQQTIPTVIESAQSYLQSNAQETAATAEAVQIVGNKLLYDGSLPLYVYDATRNMRRLYPSSARKPGVPGVYTLPPGCNLVIIGSGWAHQDDIPPTFAVAGRLYEILDEPSQERPNQEAQRIAKGLQESLSDDTSRPDVMVGIVNVAPWEDTRPVWVQRADYALRAPSTLAYWTASKMLTWRAERYMDPESTTAGGNDTLAGVGRRELYEDNSRAGRIGRTIARIGDLAILGLATYRLATGLLELKGVPVHYLEAFLGHHSPSPGTYQPHIDLGSEPPESTIPDDTGPPLPPLAPHTTEQFPTSFTALAHDPQHGGRPSNVTFVLQDGIKYYGEQAGLSPADIAKLQHDNAIIGGGIHAFTHDTHDPDNARAQYDAHKLNAGDTYSTRNVGAYEQKVVADVVDHLGAGSPPPTDDPQTSTPVPMPFTPPDDSTTPQAQSLPGLPSAPSGPTFSRTLAIVAGTMIAGIGFNAVRAIVGVGQRSTARVATRQELIGNPHIIRAHGMGLRAKRLLRSGLLVDPDDVIGTQAVVLPKLSAKEQLLRVPALVASFRERRRNRPSLMDD